MGGKGTKEDLIREVSARLEIALIDVRVIVKAYEEAMMARLIREGRLQTVLGVFEVREMKAGTGRNPKTGEKAAIPEWVRILYRASDTIKRRVKENRVREHS